MTSALVLAVGVLFGQPPSATPVEFDSVVEILPPRPDCEVSDPRTATWLLANVLALRIDCRGHRLSRPDIDQDVAARLRLENLRDARSMLRALELLDEMDQDHPPLFTGR